MGLRSDFFFLILFTSFIIFMSSLSLVSSEDDDDATQTLTINPMIKKICDNVTNPHICSTTIVPYLDGKTDASAVFRMQATAAMHAIQDAVVIAKKLADESNDKSAAARFKGCADSYKSALDDYTDALTALEQKDPGNLGVQLSAVVAMLSTCDDTITEDESMPETTNPMTDINLLINKMNDNCFDMRHIIFPDFQDPPGTSI